MINYSSVYRPIESILKHFTINFHLLLISSLPVIHRASSVYSSEISIFKQGAMSTVSASSDTDEEKLYKVDNVQCQEGGGERLGRLCPTAY